VSEPQDLRARFEALCEQWHIPTLVGYAIAICVVSSLLLVMLIPVTAICDDGWRSPSQNRSGTCSHHDGVFMWVAPYLGMLGLTAFGSFVIIAVWAARTPQGSAVLSLCVRFLMVLAVLGLWLIARLITAIGRPNSRRL
jgi:hypothetical protein